MHGALTSASRCPRPCVWCAGCAMVDGDVPGIGSMALYRKPMAFARALARAGTQELTPLGFTGALVAELLAAAGAIKTLCTCYFGLEFLGPAPAQRRAIEQARIGIVDETGYNDRHRQTHRAHAAGARRPGWRGVVVVGGRCRGRCRGRCARYEEFETLRRGVCRFTDRDLNGSCLPTLLPARRSAWKEFPRPTPGDRTGFDQRFPMQLTPCRPLTAARLAVRRQDTGPHALRARTQACAA